MNFRRLIGGLSFLIFVTGGLLLCFIPGGILNPLGGWHLGVTLNGAGHIIGFVCIGISAVGFLLLWSVGRMSADGNQILNLRRLLGGLSLLIFLLGALLLCLIPGGFLNPMGWHRYPSGVMLERAGHIFGFVCIGIAAVGFVVLWSWEKK